MQPQIPLVNPQSYLFTHPEPLLQPECQEDGGGECFIVSPCICRRMAAQTPGDVQQPLHNKLIFLLPQSNWIVQKSPKEASTMLFMVNDNFLDVPR